MRIESGDHDGGDRIGAIPTEGEDEDGCDDGGRRACRIGEHVDGGGPEIQAAGLSPREIPGADEVDDQTDGRHDEHDVGLDMGRGGESSNRFHDHRDRGDSEDDPVGRRRQDLGAPVAEGLAARPRAAAERLGPQGEPERAGVGQHMAGVRDQRQAPRPDAGSDLDDQKCAGERERDEETPSGYVAQIARVIMVVIMAAVVVVTVVVVTVVFVLGPHAALLYPHRVYDK